MKRGKFIKHLEAYNCYLARHGANHDIYRNDLLNTQIPVPRHNDIKEILCDKICKQLNIPKP